MKKIKILFFVIASFALLVFAKKIQIGLVIEGPLMLVVLWLINKHQIGIATWFRSWPLPAFIMAIVSFFPFMLYEENINCLPSGCKIIPDTLQFLTIFMIVFLILTMIFKAKHIKKTVMIFSLIGLFIEFTYGAGVTQLWALPPHWFIFFVFWVFISYAFIGIIPINVLLSKK